MNLDAVRETFNLLAYPNVRWAAVARGGKIDGGYARSGEELAAFAYEYNERRGWNFYVQPNPSKRLGGVRVNADDVTEWRWFIVDLDPLIEYPVGSAAVAEAIYAMQGYFGKDVEPLVLFSGRGYQLWYRVNGWPGPLDRSPSKVSFASYVGVNPFVEHTDLVPSPITLPTSRAIAIASRYWLSRLQGRMRAEWGIEVDLSVSDLPRLARCPGTVNQKTGKTAYVVHEGRGALDGQSFLRWVPTREYVQAAPTAGPRVGADAPWQLADPYITRRASAFLSRGEGEPGRHDGACSTARSLAEAGVGQDEIVAALVHGGLRCAPPLTDLAYIERTAREAVERVNRTK